MYNIFIYFSHTLQIVLAQLVPAWCPRDGDNAQLLPAHAWPRIFALFLGEPPHESGGKFIPGLQLIKQQQQQKIDIFVLGPTPGGSSISPQNPGKG